MADIGADTDSVGYAVLLVDLYSDYHVTPTPGMPGLREGGHDGGHVRSSPASAGLPVNVYVNKHGRLIDDIGQEIGAVQSTFPSSAKHPRVLLKVSSVVHVLLL